MTINLEDIRTAVIDYLNTKVIVSISALVADVPNVISPGEGFTFSVTVNNTGGIPLKNVIYRLWVNNPAIGKLIVPATTPGIGPGIARSGPLTTSPVLTAGSEVNEMYLFPPNAIQLPPKFQPIDSANYLYAGDTDIIFGLTGKAKVLGNTTIKCQIYAEVDMGYLFPNAPTAQQGISSVRALSVQ